MADRYWVGGTDNWNATAGTKWSTTSGGAGGAAVPTSSDNVFIDANSGSVTITLSSTANVLSLDFTGFTGSFVQTSTLTLNGDFTLSSTMTYSGSGQKVIDDSCSMTSNGITISGILSIAAAFTLADDLISSSSIIIQNTGGIFDSAGFDVTCTNFTSGGSTLRSVLVDGSTISASQSIGISGTNLTFSDVGTTWILTSTTSATFTSDQIFNGRVLLANRCALSLGSSLFTPTFMTELSFLTPGARIEVGGTVILDSDCILSNTVVDGLWTIMTSATPNVQGTISQSSGLRTMDNFAFQDMNFTGGASFAGENCIDLGNVTGIDLDINDGVPRGDDYFLYAETSGPTDENPFGTSTED